MTSSLYRCITAKHHVHIDKYLVDCKVEVTWHYISNGISFFCHGGNCAHAIILIMLLGPLSLGGN